MILSEKELKEKFWKAYNEGKRALRWQFECPAREGGIDLVTLEKFKDEYQINAFEFKLNDIKKVVAQAKANSKYATKSWIVVPIYKENLILNRYINELDTYENELKIKRNIGVMGVYDNGSYKVIHTAKPADTFICNKAIKNVIFAKGS
ncbi:hypothetical protein [Faecalicoccus pleomorphus]|uniref:hypothetical protein n=1 Tax=Faecalicoccus pleomorphus TaxID=1323 RepID=UPI00195F49BD|nr:hypothetical protein [Faecalicoccus pleomorphus]MBM6808325.1 hypothetical protein [Faecalicoccus pleomorphus]